MRGGRIWRQGSTQDRIFFNNETAGPRWASSATFIGIVSCGVLSPAAPSLLPSRLRIPLPAGVACLLDSAASRAEETPYVDIIQITQNELCIMATRRSTRRHGYLWLPHGYRLEKHKPSDMWFAPCRHSCPAWACRSPISA